MDYMFLIYHDTAGYQTVTPEIIAQAMKAHQDIKDEANAKGILKSAAGLGMPQSAKSIHLSDGNLTTTDGPFAETKEALGGITSSTAKTMKKPSTGQQNLSMPAVKELSNTAKSTTALVTRRPEIRK